MKLTRDERKAVLDGKHPTITRPGDEPCPCAKGERIVVLEEKTQGSPAPIVSICIQSIKRGAKREHLLEYSVRDDRGVHQGKIGYVNDSRFAVRAQDSHSAATLDSVSLWDMSPEQRALGSPPEPELVHPDEIATLRLSMKARLDHRAQQAKERTERDARADAKRVSAHLRDTAVRASRLGIDPTVFLAGVEQQIRAQEQACDEAA